jgi:RimJ/RimL family protein N-acetyltransferase
MIVASRQIQTVRLLLRAPQVGDGAEVNRAVLDSWDDLSPWMRWANRKPTAEESEQYNRQAIAQFESGEGLGYRAYLLTVPQTMVAAVGLHPANAEVPSWEIGYWCRTGYTGQGYISEAVHALVRMAFVQMKARRLEIRCDANNTRSSRVAERCGFTLEGRLRDEQVASDGNLRDTLIYSLLAREYPPLPRS